MSEFQSHWPRRRLGHTGLMVSPLGFGGAGIGGVLGDVTDEEAVACVHFALEQGINFMYVIPPRYPDRTAISAMASV